MKKVVMAFISMMIASMVLVGCGQGSQPDYKNADEFVQAIKNGDDVTGKTVRFTVKDVMPNATIGYDVQGPNNLNFVSSEEPLISDGDKAKKVEKGDVIVAKIKSVKKLMGAYIVSYVHP